MSDDFDKDDLSWLRGDDNPDDEESQEEDDAFSWLEESSQTPDAGQGDRLGVTGELPWLSGQGDKPGTPSLGMTGELPWLQPDGNETPSAPDEDTPEWLREAAPSTAPSTPQPPLDDVDTPEWLRDASAAEPTPDLDAPDWLVGKPEEDFPEWLAGEDVSISTPTTEPDMPEWLMEEPPAPDAPEWLRNGASTETAQPGEDVPEWLRDAAPESAPAFDDDFFRALDAASNTTSADTTLDEDFFSAFESTPGEAELAPDWLQQPAESTTTADRIAEGDESSFDMPSEEDLLPDWLQTDDQLPEPVPDDVLSALGLTPELDVEAPLAAETEEQPGSVEDYIASLGAEEPEAPVDWFAEETEESIDWLQDLGELEPSPMPEPQAEAATGDFLAELGADFDLELDEQEPAPQDIDSILATLDDTGATLPDTGELLSQNIDLDTLFSDPAFSEVETARRETTLPPDMPDFLTELGASVSAISAAAMLRQRQDRPLDELSDRLQKLRDRAEEIPVTPAEPVSSVLPGITGGLAPSVVEIEAPGLANTVVITPDQQRKVDLLKSLAVMTEQEITPAAPSAIDLTYGSRFLTDEDELSEPEIESETGEPLPEAPVPVKEPRARAKIDRILVALVLAAAVIAPFFLRPLRIGSLPPNEFATGSRQQAVFDALQAVNRDDLVLFAAEYGATAASELDTTTAVLLRHVIARGARPVVLSGNPVSVLRLNNLLTEIAPALRPNDDYYVLRYLSGEAVGLRTLTGGMGTLLATDLRGGATGLDADTLDDFAVVVLIAERQDDLRSWAEQVAPLTTTPLLAAVGAAAEPLSAPYLNTGIDGLLVGYRDAYTYGAMLRAAPVIQAAPEETLEPLPTVIEATVEAGVETTPEASPEMTMEAVATEGTIQAGVITATSNVNVREQPARDATIIARLEPGASVLVLEESDEWVKILLNDGQEGWIASNLVRVITTPGETVEPPAATSTTRPSATPVPATSTPRPTVTTRPTNTPSVMPTQTTEPSATPAPATSTPRPTVTEAPTRTPVQTRVTARVTADQRVNVRMGAGTDTAVIAAVNPGTELEVIGRNGDGSWIQVRLEDGREGWISAALVEVTAEEVTPTPTQDSGELIVVMADADFGSLFAQTTDEPTTEPTEVTETAEEAAAETTVEPTVEVTEEAAGAAQAIPYAEERWYAMTLGLVASIVIILIGAVINIARAVLRRER